MEYYLVSKEQLNALTERAKELNEFHWDEVQELIDDCHSMKIPKLAIQPAYLILFYNNFISEEY